MLLSYAIGQQVCSSVKFIPLASNFNLMYFVCFEFICYLVVSHFSLKSFHLKWIYTNGALSENLDHSEIMKQL